MNKMKLGKLYDTYNTPDNDFLKLYQQTTLIECTSLIEIKQKIGKIFLEADNYAINNKMKYKYFQLANKPLWEELSIDKQYFIYKGFDAWIDIDMQSKNILPHVIVKNNNVSNLQEGQILDIDDTFLKSLNELQRKLFLESLSKLENEVVDKIKKVWSLEQQRIDKWVKTTKIDLQGK